MEDRDAAGTRKDSGPTKRNEIVVQPSESSFEPSTTDIRPTTASTQQNGLGGNFSVQERLFESKFDKDGPFSAPITATTAMSPVTPTDTMTPTTEDFRPGLGPMIKKKSTKEIAATFRRAATAANAFKPRPGGTGDKSKVDSPTSGDGITGVFQAPSLLRGAGQDDVSTVNVARRNSRSMTFCWMPIDSIRLRCVVRSLFWKIPLRTRIASASIVNV